jgi:hypothetical protein
VEYRDVEYTVVQGIERGVWKWSVSAGGMIVAAGQEQSRPEAIAAAEKAIDRAIKRYGSFRLNALSNRTPPD